MLSLGSNHALIGKSCSYWGEEIVFSLSERESSIHLVVQ